uniref:Uncharacterized protein n=1 Tax=Arundo donax TaxID=35708 RepID=A0A0A9H755_ARUDO
MRRRTAHRFSCLPRSLCRNWCLLCSGCSRLGRC